VIHGGALVSTCAVRGVRCRWSGYPPQSGKTFKCQQQRRSRPRCVSSGRRTPRRAVSDAVEVCDIRRLTLRLVRKLLGTPSRNTESDARQSALRFPTIYRLAIPVDACTARPGTGVQLPPPPRNPTFGCGMPHTYKTPCDGVRCYFRLLSIRIAPYALNIMAPFM